MKSKPMSSAIVVCTMVLISPSITGQTCNDPTAVFTDTIRIGVTPSVEFDKYGTSVGVSGDYAIGGAIEEGPGTDQKGFALIHYRHQGGLDQWGEIKRLVTPSDPLNPPEGDQFGISVGISTLTGDYIIVGAHKDDPNMVSNAGSAYIFERNLGGQDNWGLAATLTAVNPTACVPDLTQNDNFGAAVAISGDVAIVGAPGDDDASPNAGAVYFFRRDSAGVWQCEQKFIGEFSTDNFGDNFGGAVDIAFDESGAMKDLAAVGAIRHDARDTDAGRLMRTGITPRLYAGFSSGSSSRRFWWGRRKILSAPVWANP